MRQVFKSRLPHPAVMWCDFIQAPIPMQQWDCTAPATKNTPHRSRVMSIGFQFLRHSCKQDIIGRKKLAQALRCNRVQIADHPTACFIFPIIGYSDEFSLVGNVWKEGKRPASYRPEIALAVCDPFARNQRLAFRRLLLQGCSLMYILSLPFLPEVRIGI